MPIWKWRQFGNVAPYLFVQALHMPRSKNSSGVYRPEYKKQRTSRLSRSASIRVHVDVRNGYGMARGVGAAPGGWRLNKAIWPRIPVPGIVYSFCRRYLRTRKKTVLCPSISGWRADQARSKWETFQQHQTQQHVKDEFERSTTGITRVLLDVSCSSCSLSNLFACHSSQLLAITVFHPFKPCRRQAKQTLESIPPQNSRL